ncbi:hypothetical protein JCM3775_002777 [Rhodotorula graminis]
MSSHSSVNASPATALLDLPDELLSSILRDCIYSASDRRGAVVELFTVSRRIYRLARPLALECIVALSSSWFDAPSPTALELVDQFFGRLATLSPFYSHIKSLDVGRVDAPILLSNLLVACPALESLNVGDALDVGDVLPERVLRALPKVKSLRSLSLDAPFSLGDPSFDLRTTSIRRLSILREHKLLLADGKGNNIDELDLYDHLLEGCAIPWSSLKVLRLHGHGGRPFEDGASVLPALGACVY